MFPEKCLFFKDYMHMIFQDWKHNKGVQGNVESIKTCIVMAYKHVHRTVPKEFVSAKRSSLKQECFNMRPSCVFESSTGFVLFFCCKVCISLTSYSFHFVPMTC